MTEYDSPANNAPSPANLRDAYQQVITENAALRAERKEIEARVEKRLALLKQQIAQRKKAEEALQRESDIVKLLQEVAVAANEAQSVEAALQFALNKICAHMDWPLGRVYMQTPNESGEPIPSRLRFCQDPQFEPVQAAFALPVLAGAEVVALLEFFIADDAPPGPDVVEVMGHIAMQLGRVAERAQAEAALRDSERRFRAIFNQTFQFAGLLKPDGTLLEANQTALVFGGLQREDVVGRPFWETGWWVNSPEAQERLQTAVRQAANGRFVRYETSVSGEGDRVAAIDFSIKPVANDDGEVIWLIAEGRDITEQKETENRLIETQRHARQTAEMLRAANAALTETLDLKTVLATLLEYLAQIAPYDSGDILLRNRTSFTVAALKGYAGESALGRHLPVAVNKHIAAVVAQMESVIIDDCAAEPDWRPHLEGAEAARSWLGIPLLVGGQLIGVCSLNHYQPGYFTEERRALAEALTAQAAVAIQNARWLNELRASREQLRLLAQQVVSIQEEERRRVSRELHDEAGQSLTALKMSLDLIQADLPPSLTMANQSVAEAIELTDETMERIRLLAYGLRPPALDMLGLNAALEGLCRELAARANLTVKYDGLELPGLPDTVAISLYRLAQEALTNVIKHADASQAQVVLRRSGRQLSLLVADDGRGFHLEEQSGIAPGMGLIGMAERMKLLGGEFPIESEPGRGTRLTAYAPLPIEKESA
jgi:PAS domain S-box-containing protein